eukprot:m.176806 g.176806  ORF g.176806 m.176806 type:complete len:303 (+) comp24460_c0_seq1:1735-2643(+)
MAFALKVAVVASVLVCGVAGKRNVSFWYAPASYGGSDIGAVLQVLKNNSGAVTSVMNYCGTSIGPGGSLLQDEANAALCTKTLLPGLTAIGVNPEIVLNSGTNNVSDYRLFFANASQQIPVLVSVAKRFGAVGINMDLEPQVGSPSSTPADAVVYAAFCAKLKVALNAIGVRLTIAVANWSPMLSNFKVLAPSVDRLMSMETYNANSMAGWLGGDAFGGDYNELVAPGVLRTNVAPGLGCWPALCGKNPCWTTTAASGPVRMDKITADDIPEVAMFRLIQIPSQQWPQQWWWPLLKTFANSD